MKQRVLLLAAFLALSGVPAAAGGPGQDTEPGGDAVVLRSGKRVEGRITEFDSYVLVETEKGKQQKISRGDILRIERQERLLRFPELREFPNEVIGKGIFRYETWKDVLIAFPTRPQETVIHAVRPDTGQMLWKKDVRNHVGAPLLLHGILYTLRYQTYIDDKQKYKHLGVQQSKEVHKLTLEAIDVATGDLSWSMVFDNNDRRDLLWKYIKDSIFLHDVKGQVLLRAAKRGNVIKGGELKTDEESTYVTFTLIDPETQKVVRKQDSPEAVEAGRFFFVDDFFLFEEYLTQSKWSVSALSLRNGKIKWSNEYISHRLMHADEERFYLEAGSTILAHSVKNGKPLKKWQIDITSAGVAGFDAERVYVHRTTQEPRGIFAYELESAKLAFRISCGRNDEIEYLGRMGPYILYADRANALHAFDVNRRVEVWKFAGAGTAPSLFHQIHGTGMVVYKDGRVYLIDLFTGSKIWEVPGDFNLVLAIGPDHILCRRIAGARVIAGRTPPKGSVFLVPQRTPIRYVLGVNRFSPPAVDAGNLFTLAENGTLYGWSLDGKKRMFEAVISKTQLGNLPPPAAAEGRVGVTHTSRLTVFDASSGKKIYDSPHYITDLARPYLFNGDTVVLPTPQGASRIRWKDGSKVWERGPIPSVSWLTPGDDTYFLIAGQNLHILFASDGETRKTHLLPSALTRILVQGEAIYGADQGRRVVRYREGETAFEWSHEIADPRAKPVLGYLGTLAVAEGIVLSTTLDREIVGLDADTGEKKWTYPAKEMTSGFVSRGGSVWLVDYARGAVALDPKTGRETRVVPLHDAAKFSPVVLKDKLYFWSSDGWMFSPEP